MSKKFFLLTLGGFAAVLVIVLAAIGGFAFFRSNAPATGSPSPAAAQPPGSPPPPEISLTIRKLTTGNSLIVQWSQSARNHRGTRPLLQLTRKTPAQLIVDTLERNPALVRRTRRGQPRGAARRMVSTLFVLCRPSDQRATNWRAANRRNNHAGVHQRLNRALDFGHHAARRNDLNRRHASAARHRQAAPQAEPETPTPGGSPAPAPTTTPTATAPNGNGTSTDTGDAGNQPPANNPGGVPPNTPNGTPYYNPQVQIYGYAASGSPIFWVQQANQGIEIGWQNIPPDTDTIVILRASDATGPWNPFLTEQNLPTNNYQLQVVDGSLDQPYYYEMQAISGSSTIATYGPDYLTPTGQ